MDHTGPSPDQLNAAQNLTGNSVTDSMQSYLVTPNSRNFRDRLDRWGEIGENVVYSVLAVGSLATLGYLGKEVYDEFNREPPAVSAENGDPNNYEAGVAGLETTVTPEPINCSEMNIDIPVLLESDAAKEAVSHIEFLFDDPEMVEQVQESINASASQAGVEAIMQHTFATRGITLTFGQREGANWHESDQIPSLDDFKLKMVHAIDAYARVPAALAAYAPEIHFANQLVPNDPEGMWAGALAYHGIPVNLVDYDYNLFDDLQTGVAVVYHELTHHVDAETCTAELSKPDEIFNVLRSRSYLTNHEMSTEQADRITQNPPVLADALNVIPSTYARTDANEDKAETVAHLTMNYPDSGDGNFANSPLLQERQQIMIRRLAEELNMPEMAELFQFFDIYGIDQHPKQIIADDLSPVSLDLGLFEDETRLLQPIVMPNGQTDNFIIATNGTYFNMYMEVKIPANESAKCDQNTQVMQLMELGAETMDRLTHGSMNRQAIAVPGVIDPVDGKLICMIQVVGSVTQ